MASRNDYAIFFGRQEAGDTNLLRLPVNPEKLPISQGNANDAYNVLGIGPVMVPRTPELKTIQIESYFPGKIDRLTLTSGNFLPPETYIRFFRNAMQNGEVLLFTVTRYYEDGTPYGAGAVPLSVLVTSFQTEERGGETGDFYYTLELTEYWSYAPLTVQIQTEATESTPAVATAQQTRSIPEGQLYVGYKGALNGDYYYSSYGDEPHGSGNGRTVVVSRIVEEAGRAYPIHVTTDSGGALGWCKKEALRKAVDA